MLGGTVGPGHAAGRGAEGRVDRLALDDVLELWLLGLGSHCAVEYTQIVWPQVFDWLEERLRAATPQAKRERRGS